MLGVHGLHSAKLLGAVALLHGKPRRQPQAARATTCFRDTAETPTKPAQQVTVRFSTHYKTAFGEGLKVVGSLTELGAWEVDAAPAMHWQDGDFWNVDVTLPAGEAFEAKLVHLSAHSVTWEPGRNREVAVPPSGLPLPPGAAVEVACAFAYTDQTALALAGPAAASLAVDEAVAEVHVGVAPSANEPGLCDAAVTVAEPLLRPASFDQAEAAVEDTEALEGQALPAPLPVLAAELGAPADAPAATKADAAGNAKALWDVGRAAGLAAAVVAAGVATSALAIDLDLAVAGALVAAGASLLQGGGKADAKGLSVVGKSLGAAESVARAFGLKSHAERRAAATAAPGAAIGAAAPAAAELAFPSADDVAAADARLAACIAEAEARPGPPSRMQAALADEDSKADAADGDTL